MRGGRPALSIFEVVVVDKGQIGTVDGKKVARLVDWGGRPALAIFGEVVFDDGQCRSKQDLTFGGVRVGVRKKHR